MAIHWGVDLGTSNTTICEDRTGSPRIVHLPGLVNIEPLTQTSVVASCVRIMDDRAKTVLIGLASKPTAPNCAGSCGRSTSVPG